MQGCIIVSFQQITFKLGHFSDFRRSFSRVDEFFANWSQLKDEKIVEGVYGRENVFDALNISEGFN